MAKKRRFMLDTNIIINMAKYVKGDTIYNGSLNGLTPKNTNGIIQIYNQIQSGQIEVYISPYVYDELLQGVEKYGDFVIGFLQILNIKSLTYPARHKS
ncbi:MAG: hypothetical protein E7378_00735 [Clostridiales bacterium]|nr:hypothetical protein [Clostridiales bacterium]